MEVPRTHMTHAQRVELAIATIKKLNAEMQLVPPIYDENEIMELFKETLQLIGKELGDSTKLKIEAVQTNVYSPPVNSDRSPVKYLLFDLYITGEATGCMTTFTAQLQIPRHMDPTSEQKKVCLDVICPLGHEFTDHGCFDRSNPASSIKRRYLPPKDSRGENVQLFKRGNVELYMRTFAEKILTNPLFTTKSDCGESFNTMKLVQSETNSCQGTITNNIGVISTIIKKCREVTGILAGGNPGVTFNPLTDIKLIENDDFELASTLCAVRYAIDELDARVRRADAPHLSAYDLEKLLSAYTFLTKWEQVQLSAWEALSQKDN